MWGYFTRLCNNCLGHSNNKRVFCNAYHSQDEVLFRLTVHLTEKLSDRTKYLNVRTLLTAQEQDFHPYFSSCTQCYHKLLQ